MRLDAADGQQDAVIGGYKEDTDRRRGIGINRVLIGALEGVRPGRREGCAAAAASGHLHESALVPSGFVFGFGGVFLGLPPGLIGGVPVDGGLEAAAEVGVFRFPT